MRERCLYGSVRGARGETRVPTATAVLSAHVAAPAQVSNWHEAGGECSAAFLPLLNEVQTELAQVRTGGL
jgi:hypothetical protein